MSSADSPSVIAQEERIHDQESIEKKDVSPKSEHPGQSDQVIDAETPSPSKKGGLGPVALIFACGAALFSDGYVNANSGPTGVILAQIKPYGQDPNVDFSYFKKLYSSMAFAGTVVGMLLFGVLSDRIGRKFGMIFASLWLTLWSVLIAGAYGAGGSVKGLFAALEAYRFIIGIAIGAEYPAGSVACSENTEAKDVNGGRQQMYFIMATNTMIDLGFVAANLVALIMFQIFGKNHLEWVWRMTLGLGAIPPLVVFFFRTKMSETSAYKRGAIKRNVPWLLIMRKYWVRLLAVCLAWFIYDYVSYPAGLYSGYFVDKIVPDDTDLTKVLGWSTLINAFYLPGTIIGAFVSDRLGPKNTMIIGLVCQCAIGFGLAGGFGSLKNNLPGIVILYGIYVAFGEFGPGNNLGLLASKAVAPSAVRGTFYGIAAAIGKIGAFTGSYVYTQIQQDLAPEGDSNNLYYSGPFYIGSGLAVVSALITFFFIPAVTKDGMQKIDREFEEYLAANGYDMSNMGLIETHEKEQMEADNAEKASH
ncbi:hypothetical protein L7F22_067969 [Adiantum nelumboides]|nr:hypothetical protein [Adiantum nelumboides]